MGMEGCCIAHVQQALTWKHRRPKRQPCHAHQHLRHPVSVRSLGQRHPVTVSSLSQPLSRFLAFSVIPFQNLLRKLMAKHDEEA